MPVIGRCATTLVLAVTAGLCSPARGGTSCTGDTNGDGQVNVQDLVTVLLNWDCANPCSQPQPPCCGDLNLDGAVDVQDLVIVILTWGTCTLPTGACCHPDSSCTQVTEAECAESDGSYQGTGMACSPALCPGGADNDPCTGAVRLLVPGDTTGDTTMAGPDGVPLCGTTVTAPGVWYSVVGTGNTIFATTCTDFFDYDTKMSVYCGSCASLTCVAGSDDSCFNGASTLLTTVSWCSEFGTEYLILVHGFASATGAFELMIFDDQFPCMSAISCAPLGACCFGGDCEGGLAQDECIMLGGQYQGDLTSCQATVVYEATSCASPLEDISGSGTEAPNASNQDDGGDVVNLGFTFEYFGVQHTQVGISANGYLSFDSNLSDFSNDPIPSQNPPDDLIAPWWDDWNPAAAGTVHHQTLGPIGGRRFIVQWTGVPHVGGTGTSTFQAILFEATDCIQFRYGAALNFNSPTVGVESPDGLDGLSINGAGVAPGDCLELCPVDMRPAKCR